MTVAAIATLYAKPERADALEAILVSFADRTRTEEGCLTYDVHRDARDPSVFVLYEIWTSEETLKQHHGQPYMVEFFGQQGEYMAKEWQLQPLVMKSELAKR